jgi:lysophospholipase L1-like esterase
VQLLRENGFPFTAPEIIARTGWTTDELNSAIADTRLLPVYDVVTLLIGVNNQYRGRSCEEYKIQLQSLLQQAIGFAAGRSDRVFILSIPDWSVSPFAADRDRNDIARQIDAFNAAAKETAAQQKTTFIDITTHARTQVQPFAADGLHPAGEQYRFWAKKLVEQITRRLACQ